MLVNSITIITKAPSQRAWARPSRYQELQAHRTLRRCLPAAAHPIATCEGSGTALSTMIPAGARMRRQMPCLRSLPMLYTLVLAAALLLGAAGLAEGATIQKGRFRLRLLGRDTCTARGYLRGPLCGATKFDLSLALAGPNIWRIEPAVPTNPNLDLVNQQVILSLEARQGRCPSFLSVAGGCWDASLALMAAKDPWVLEPANRAATLFRFRSIARTRANCAARYLGARDVTSGGTTGVSCPAPDPKFYPNQPGSLTVWALERLPDSAQLAPPSLQPPPPSVTRCTLGSACMCA
ncbi:hypothetical protein ABPG75_013534 [Micractinium tetrahymenae]